MLVKWEYVAEPFEVMSGRSGRASFEPIIYGVFVNLSLATCGGKIAVVPKAVENNAHPFRRSLCAASRKSRLSFFLSRLRYESLIRLFSYRLSCRRCRLGLQIVNCSGLGARRRVVFLRLLNFHHCRRGEGRRLVRRTAMSVRRIDQGDIRCADGRLLKAGGGLGIRLN